MSEKRYTFSFVSGSAEHVQAAAGYLDETDPLDIEVFTSEKTGQHLIRAVIAMNGPTVQAEYDESIDCLELSYHHGSDKTVIAQGSGNESPLLDLMREIASAY